MTKEEIEYALSLWEDTRQETITREEAALIVEGLNDVVMEIPASLSGEFVEGWEAAIAAVAMFLRFKDCHL